MADKNLKSYNGPQDSNQTFNNPDEVLDGSNGYNDTLKCSTSLCRTSIHYKKVIGGSEDCCDINNKCFAVSVSADEWESRGKYVFTVKGESKDIYLQGKITRHGSEVDVDLGNNSDQGNGQTKGVILNLTSDEPITVRVLQAQPPITVAGSGPYKFVFPKPNTWYHPIVIFFFRILCKVNII